MTAKIKIPGVSQPDGLLTFKYAGRSTKVKVHDYHKGTVIFTLPELRPGSYSISATYSKSTYSRGSQSNTVNLSVG